MPLKPSVGLSGLPCLPHSFVIRTEATYPAFPGRPWIVPWKRSGGICCFSLGSRALSKSPFIPIEPVTRLYE